MPNELRVFWEVSWMGEELILATMPMIPKYEVEEVMGVIYGSSPRTRVAGGRILSGFQALTGGKGTAYAEEIEKARKEALGDLKNEARKLRVNGVLSIDFETAEILKGFILVTAYGIYYLNPDALVKWNVDGTEYGFETGKLKVTTVSPL
jgi:uncharacterized protein YbjQ (UPF0145 family)